MIWVLAILALYLAVLFFAVWLSLHPFRTPVFISPGSLKAPQAEFEAKTEDGVAVRGWRVDHEAPRGVAVLLHGYMMNRSELTPLAAWLHEQGWASFIVDLRAHGRSGGRRSTFGVLERRDVAAVAKAARAAYPGAPLVLLGSSMGSAAAAFALAEEPALADGLVLDSGYSRLPEAVLGWWFFLGGAVLRLVLAPTVLLAAPFVGFNPFRIDVARALKRIDAPVLIIHGDADTLATPWHARRNRGACRNGSDIVWLPGCGHSEGRWIHPDAYYGAVQEFLGRVESQRSTQAATSVVGSA